MIRQSVCLLIAATALLTAEVGAARADIEVDPKPGDASVVLDGARYSPSHPAPTGEPAGTNAPFSAGPTFDPVDTCRIDKDVLMFGCRKADPKKKGDDKKPELTPGDVLRATKKIGLPALAVQVQPGGATLVNVDTIFYAQPSPFERSVKLLDHTVDISATPTTFLWDHGDGTTSTTTTAGRPYPAKDVTHRYDKRADDISTRVDVTYRVRFRVDGGAWQTIPQTLTASGPTTVLDVKEAAPVLTRP